jgi:hypothetical protein
MQRDPLLEAFKTAITQATLAEEREANAQPKKQEREKPKLTLVYSKPLDGVA